MPHFLSSVPRWTMAAVLPNDKSAGYFIRQELVRISSLSKIIFDKGIGRLQALEATIPSRYVSVR